jgi:hypothetical protein
LDSLPLNKSCLLYNAISNAEGIENGMRLGMIIMKGESEDVCGDDRGLFKALVY